MHRRVRKGKKKQRQISSTPRGYEKGSKMGGGRGEGVVWPLFGKNLTCFRWWWAVQISIHKLTAESIRESLAHIPWGACMYTVQCVYTVCTYCTVYMFPFVAKRNKQRSRVGWMYVFDPHTSKAKYKLKVVLLHLWRVNYPSDWRIYLSRLGGFLHSLIRAIIL